MTATVKLLPWQQKCLDRFEKETKQDFVLIAGTGTGKTTAGSAMALSAFSSLKFSRKKPLIMVFCPFRSIKEGWAKTFSRLGLFYAEKPQEVAPDRDAIITTYAGAGTLMTAIVKLLETRELIFVFDEFHHLEENGKWADPILNGVFDSDTGRMVTFTPHKRIFLSGTPWREDGTFPGDLVPYVDDKDGNKKVVADFTHSYGENVNLAYDEGKNTVAVRFEPKKMEVTYQHKDNDGNPVGEPYTVHTDKTIRSGSIAPFVRFENIKQFNKLTGLVEMVDEAVEELDSIRNSGAMPRAGGIIFVSGQREGRVIQAYLEDVHGKNALFVKSDDPKSHDEIKRFSDGSDEWIIAIDMIAEGTDIPRLKVAIDMSFKLTVMHIVQRWGRVLRLLRKRDGAQDKNVDAVIYHVAHAQLRYVAENIEAEMAQFKRQTRDVEPGKEPPIKKDKELLASSSEDGEALFKGKKVSDQARELALWMIFTNYGGRAGEMGFAFALAMAETFIATDTVPDDFVEYLKQPPAERPAPAQNDDRRRRFDEAVANYTRIVNQLVRDFFPNEYSVVNNMINREMRVSYFSKDKASLAEVEARVVAAEAVKRRLYAELMPSE